MSIKRALSIAIVVSITAAALISCSGSKTMSVQSEPPPAPTGSIEVTTPRTEFTRLANDRFADQYWGIGEGISNRESMAADIASARAREGIALMMQTTIESKAKNAGLNSISGEATETFMQRLVQETQGTVADARQREVKVLFNQESGQYTVYVLMSVEASRANDALKKQISATQAITDAAVSSVLMGIIDSALDR